MLIHALLDRVNTLCFRGPALSRLLSLDDDFNDGLSLINRVFVLKLANQHV